MGLIPNNSVGLAGEYAVLSQLMLRGFDAAMTLGNTKKVDILVHHPSSGRLIKIEVKTNLQVRLRPSRSTLFGHIVSDWQMDQKHEVMDDPDLYFCFVHMNASRTTPRTYAYRYFNVPSAVVATYVREQHRWWLESDSRHRDTRRRVFRIAQTLDDHVKVQAPLASQYEDNWHFGVTEQSDKKRPNYRVKRTRAKRRGSE